jgi:acyl-CoA thioester hydrolase
MPRRAETPLRVRFAETDAQGVVYHANHLVYFEVARGEFLREGGWAYEALAAAGTFFVVAEARVTYRAPLRYDDAIVVTTRVGEVRTRSCTFEYEIRRGDTVVATGTTAHVCVDREGRAAPLPESMRAWLAG